ncbi:putative glycosyl hydrolase or carbohydrate binding protein [Chitinophaga niastensis]|uniref:Putative glycosyl hydrolase or carbohydrate binding protein n=1 Tax=Chitinophaga niastensis TaxID=536980 RepID=A0A2P8HAZ4_CHINA|nr:PCMD domain-containing protein [Chitinophaga niastensis]PSL43393.1 putative glycosyl hydrolase or carbohydrate binding protein [Chitinophaga niastensis]
MNLRKLCCLAAILGSLQSCIKDAPQNPEADIVSFTVNKDDLTGDVYIDQTNAKIRLYLKEEAFQKGIVPTITVSAGGQVSPASGDSLKFDNNGIKKYVVTSNNGANKKTYTVEVINIGTWKFDFEKWDTLSYEGADFHYLNPAGEDGHSVWASGNIGIAITGVTEIADFPLHATANAYEGKYAAEIETRPGNALSGWMNIHIFPGSMFLGNFTTDSMMQNPLKCPQFGQPYRGMPKSFTGYYKYQPGAKFQDRNENIIAGKTDACAIYAVLYNGTERLDATNILTSERIIATAILPDGSAKADWTHFDIPFKVTGTPVAPNAQVMMAIIASSSSEGDFYRGAIGSKLVLDNIEIVHE